MRTSDIQTALQALDSLPLPDQSAALRRVNAYAKAGITALNPPAYSLPKPHPPLLRHPALTAAAALALVGVGVGSVLGADLYTYGKASGFFASYGLSTEGLERGELWEVYRDIVTGQFSLPSTGQMLQSNMGMPPSGSLSAEEAESLWEGWKENYTSTVGIPLEVTYYIHVTHLNHVNGHSKKTALPYGAAFFTPDPVAEEELRDLIANSDSDGEIPLVSREQYSYTRDDNGTVSFTKLNGKESGWTVSLDRLDGYIQHASTDRYVAVTGYTEGDSPDTVFYLLSSEGDVLWSYTLDNGETQELPLYILFGEDTVTLFSWTDRTNLCRSVFDLSGRLLENSISTLEKGPIYTVKQVIPFREGHLLLMNHTDTDTSLYYMNAEGIITDSYGFEDGGGLGDPYTDAYDGAYAYDLTVERVLEANGYLYISITGGHGNNMQALHEWIRPYWAYWDKSQPNGNGVGIIDGLDILPDSSMSIKFPSEEFDARVRACYRSFLLVCDPETMEVISVTVMDGGYTTDHQASWGNEPSLRQEENGRMIWTVESPYPTTYSPYTSSFTYAGSSCRYTFTLTPDGKVSGKPDVSVGSGFRQ